MPPAPDLLAGTLVTVFPIQQQCRPGEPTAQDIMLADRDQIIDEMVMPGDPAPIIYELCGRNRHGAPFIAGFFLSRHHAEARLPQLEQQYRPRELNIRTIYPAPIPLPPRRQTDYHTKPRQRKLI